MHWLYVCLSVGNKCQRQWPVAPLAACLRVERLCELVHPALHDADIISEAAAPVVSVRIPLQVSLGLAAIWEDLAVNRRKPSASHRHIIAVRRF